VVETPFDTGEAVPARGGAQTSHKAQASVAPNIMMIPIPNLFLMLIWCET